MNINVLPDIDLPKITPEAVMPEAPTVIIPDEKVVGDGLAIVMGGCPDVIACLRNGGCRGLCDNFTDPVN